MAAAEDEDPVEAVGANRTDPTLGEGVRVRRLNGRADHLDAFRPEDLVERAAELRVPIMDQEPERLVILELHGEVARLLGDPAAGFELQVTYSIRRVESEMKKRT